MKRILVPTDFSVQAEQALKIAVQIAKAFDSEIFVLHSMELPMQLATAESANNNLPEALFFMKLVEKNFGELREREYLDGIFLNEIIGRGELYDDIEEVCERNKIDLIVMGSSGASGFKEMFVGSNTEKVVRTSKIPVVVIKDDHPELEVKDFVFASDFSEKGKKAFNEARQFANKIGAKMHLLMVNTPANFKTSQQGYSLMEDFVKDLDVEHYTLNIYNDTSVEKGILNFATYINAQLIGMGTHGRKGISHFFNGSISEDLVNHANRPIITFKI